MSRGISEEEATEMIVMGFMNNFKEFPMEYAVEIEPFNQVRNGR